MLAAMLSTVCKMCLNLQPAIACHSTCRRNENICCWAGFVRLAAEQGAWLVPVAVMGEIDTLCNFIDLPAIQRWTYKKFGFPLPYLVVGRWGFSPLPRATSLKFIIGEPIPPPPQPLPGHPVRLQCSTTCSSSGVSSLLEAL